VVDLIDKDSKLSLQIMRKYGAHIKSQYQLRKSVEFVAQQVIDGKIIVVPLGTNHLIIWGGDGVSVLVCINVSKETFPAKHIVK
jgi:hypothetical protein